MDFIRNFNTTGVQYAAQYMNKMPLFTQKEDDSEVAYVLKTLARAVATYGAAKFVALAGITANTAGALLDLKESPKEEWSNKLSDRAFHIACDAVIAFVPGAILALSLLNAFVPDALGTTHDVHPA